MDKKGLLGSSRYAFWCFAAGILTVAGMSLAAGKREISLKEEFYGRLLAEQTAGSADADGGTDGQISDAEGQTQRNKENGSGQECAVLQEESDQEDLSAEEPSLLQQTGIRVLLMDSEYNSYWHSQVTVQGNVPLKVTGAFTETCPAGQPLDLTGRLLEGEQVVVSADPQAQETGKISVLTLTRSQGIPAYEGSLTVTAAQEGFLICNQVDLETYLKYVVPSEMPSGYPAEALKAQAVCARTYAMRQISEERLEEYGADVDDSVSFQVYNNINRQDSTDEAVDATAGVVMTYEGEPIQAYFFSTSCGHTSTDEVWGGEGAPYLRSVEVSRQSVKPEALEVWSADRLLASENAFQSFLDLPGADDYEREDPWYRWQVTLPAEMLQETVDKICPQVGKLQGLTVLERSGGGAAKKLEVSGDQSTFLLEDEYSIREFLSPGDIPVLCADWSQSTAMSILPSAYFICEPVYQEEILVSVAFRGGGYGHGVGMSQNGARHMAEDGKGWQDILNVFYREIDLETLGA